MICAECGEMLPESTEACPWCGEPARRPKGAGPPSPDEADAAISAEEEAFERRLYQFPKLTTALIVVCVLLWAVMEYIGSSEDPVLLVLFGAKQHHLVMEGQWWRLISASFLHIGYKHLLFNGIALAQLGLFCENVFGSWRFFALYVISGMGGFFMATLFSNAISAGASASIFGLMGAILAFGFRHRKEIPPFFQRLFTWMLLPWVLLNLGVGGIFSNIFNVDNYAHLGGLLSGLVLAFFLGNTILAEETQPARRRAQALGAISALAVASTAFFVQADLKKLLPISQSLEVATQAEDLEESVRLWSIFIEESPDLGLYYVNRAQALTLLSRYEAAEEDLRKAIQLDHNLAVTLNKLAWTLITQGQITPQDIKEGLKHAKRSVALRKGANNLNTLGWAHYLNGEYKKSVSIFKEALSLGDEESAIFDHYMLAMTYQALDQKTQARAQLIKGNLNYDKREDPFDGVISPTDRLAIEEELETLERIRKRAHNEIPLDP